LIALTRKPKPTIAERTRVQVPPGAACNPGGYGTTALDAEATTPAAALPGTRNTALNRAAFKLFQLVAGGRA
jgi:hypothetical protein